MSEHDDDTCPHLVRASLLEAENARVKTEVQHLMIFCNSTLIPSKELQAENARLKAEVERLEHLVNYWRIEAEVDNARWLRCLQNLEELRASSFVTAVPVEEYEKLKAEVERLSKAGDAVCESPYALETDPAVIAWRAAKGGKPSA